MKLEAIVHPLSISWRDNAFDPDIHIPVEVLSHPSFQQKMLNLPVTARHHDTMRGVDLLARAGFPLNGKNMHIALEYLHKTLPAPLTLARNVLERSGLPVNPANIWATLPEVSPHARGPGVFGSVDRFFFRAGMGWMVLIHIDEKKLDPFQKKLITLHGALGQVSLTHAVLGDDFQKQNGKKTLNIGSYEPLELSFTIEGLRTGSAINRIVAASAYRASQSTILRRIPKSKMDISPPVTDVESIDSDPIRIFYDQLGELDATKNMQKTFVQHLKTVTASKATVTAAQEQRLDDLEKAFALVQEATANALNELGPSCFGNMRPRTAEESNNPHATAATLQLVLAAAANNLNKRKRETDELDEALKDVSTHKVVAASKAKNVNAPEDDFFKELRTMRMALKALP